MGFGPDDGANMNLHTHCLVVLSASHDGSIILKFSEHCFPTFDPHTQHKCYLVSAAKMTQSINAESS